MFKVEGIRGECCKNCIRKVDPDFGKTTTWDECVWQPKVEMAG